MLWALERASGDPEGGIKTSYLLDDLSIQREFVPYGELLKRRLAKLDTELENFGN